MSVPVVVSDALASAARTVLGAVSAAHPGSPLGGARWSLELRGGDAAVTDAIWAALHAETVLLLEGERADAVRAAEAGEPFAAEALAGEIAASVAEAFVRAGNGRAEFGGAR